MNLNLAGIAQGMQAAKADAIKQQQADYQNWLMQTKKQEYADQLASAGITFNSLGNRPPPINAYGGPAPTPPSPGQASVPMTPPVSPNGGMGGMQGQMAPPQATPMAQGGSMGGMAPPQASGQPQGLMPYQTVQSLAQGNAPQGGGMNVANAPPAMQTQPQGTQVRSVSDAISLINANAPEATPMQKMMALKDMIPIIQAQNSDELNLLKQAQAMAGTWEERPVQVGDQIKYVMFNKMTGETKPMGGFGGDKWNPNAAPKTRKIESNGRDIFQEYDAGTKTWNTISTSPHFNPKTGAGDGFGDTSGAPITTQDAYKIAAKYKMSPAAFDQAVDAYHSSGELPTNVRSTKMVPLQNAIRDEVANKWPDFNPATAKADFGSYKKALDANQLREEGVARATNMVKELEPQVLALAKKVNTGLFGMSGNATLNDLYRKYGNDPDVQELKNKMYSLSREYTVATTMPGSNAQMHVSHGADAEALANGNMPFTQLQGALRGINADIKAAENSTASERDKLNKLMRGEDGSGSGGKSKSVNWEDLK